MTETPPADSPDRGGKRDWRPWEASRKDTQRALRVGEPEWKDYEVICDHEGTNRNADINAFIRRRIKAFRRKNPGVPLPSDGMPKA